MEDGASPLLAATGSIAGTLRSVWRKPQQLAEPPQSGERSVQ